MRRLMKNIFKLIDNMQLFCEREAVCTHTGPLCNYSSNNAYALNSDVRCLSIILNHVFATLRTRKQILYMHQGTTKTSISTAN